VDSELRLPGISDEAIRELMDFRSKVQSLARTELSSLAQSLYNRTAMEPEAAGAVASAAGSLIEGKLNVTSSEWFKAEAKNVRRRRLQYYGGAIQQIERKARLYKRDAAQYVNKLREINKTEIELLKQQMALSLGDAENLNLPPEEKRQLRQDFRRRLAVRNSITRALGLGLRNVQGRINQEAGKIEDVARHAMRGGRDFIGSAKLAKFTANTLESIGGLAASLIGGGGTAAFFQTAGRATGLVIETGGAVVGEAVEQGSVGAGKLLGLAVGAALSKITGDPSMVQAGMKMGGKVGGTIGELVATGVRGVASTLGGMMGPFGALVGKGLEEGTQAWVVYDEAKQRLTAMGAGGSLDTARGKGYVNEQAKVAATAFLGAIGDDRMFSEFLSVGRMYGVAPSALAETLNTYKFAGGTRPDSDTSLKGLYRRVGALTQQPGMGGYGRANEVFQATSKLAGVVGSQVDAMSEDDMTALIGTQAWIGQLGEGYGGLRGADVLTKLNTAIRGEGGLASRAMGLTEVDSAESYIEYQKRKEAGLADPNNLRRLIGQVVKEWGTGEEAIGTLREVGGLRTEQARNIIGLVKEGGIESLTAENLEKLAETDKPRKEMIGAGEALSVEFESLNIKIGAAGHEMVFNIKKAQAKMGQALLKAMRGDTNGLPELLDEIAEYFKIFFDVMNAFFSILQQLLGIKLDDSAEWHNASIIASVSREMADEVWDMILKQVSVSGLRYAGADKVGGGRNAINGYIRVHPEDVYKLGELLWNTIDAINKQGAWGVGTIGRGPQITNISITYSGRDILSWSSEEAEYVYQKEKIEEDTTGKASYDLLETFR